MSDIAAAERIAWFATDIVLRGDLSDCLHDQFCRMLSVVSGDSRVVLKIGPPNTGESNGG